MATIRDVAQLAGVHPSTVSRVLSGKAPIGAEASERVRTAAEQLGFRLNRAARTLGLRETPPVYVAVVLPRIDHPFFQRILRGLHEGLTGAGAGILILPLEPEPTATLELLGRLEPDVLLPIGLSDEASGWMGDRPNLLWLDASDRKPCIGVDHEAGGAAAAAFLQASACRRPVFIGEEVPTQGQRERLLGFKKAWGKSVDVVVTQQNREAARTLVLSLAPRWHYDGVFCYCDEIAFGVQEAFRELGRKDALVGYDDHPDAKILGLNTIAQPAEELGRRAAATIDDYLKGKGWPKRRIVLQPELVRR